MPLKAEEIREQFRRAGGVDEITPEDLEQAIADVRREQNEQIREKTSRQPPP